MEQREYSNISQKQSLMLKQQLQKKTAELYEVLQKCLDYSQCVYPTDPTLPQCSLTSSLKRIHNTIIAQLKLLAVQQSCYNAALDSLSQNLIKQQISYDQSYEMHVLLKAYQERISPLRSHLIEKQNQLYCLNKFYFQCFEDEYENCLPSRKRLSTVQTSFQSKQNILRVCVQKGREQAAYLLEKQRQIETKENGRSICFQQVENNKIQELFTNIKEVVEEEEYIQEQNFATGHLDTISNNLSVVGKRPDMFKPALTKNNTKINLKYCPNFLSQQEKTSASLKKAEGLLKNQKVKKNPLVSCKKLPNFSQMPQHDYQLFRIYYKKIEKQNERFDKLNEQYINYLEVYRVVTKQKKRIFKKTPKVGQKKCEQNISVQQQFCQAIQSNFIHQSKININQQQLDNYFPIADQKERQNVLQAKSKFHPFMNSEQTSVPQNVSTSPTTCQQTQKNMKEQLLKFSTPNPIKSPKISSKTQYQYQQTSPSY